VGFLEHPVIDQYAGLSSPIHAVEPRIKLVSCLGLMVSIVSLSSVAALVGAVLVLAVFLLVSRLPVRYVLARLLVALPFSAAVLFLLPFTEGGSPLLVLDLGFWHLAASREGFTHAVVLSLRLVAALLVVTLLTSTTRFTTLLRAMESLRVPPIFPRLMEFTVRYLFILVDEIQRMQRARQSRGFKARRLWEPTTLRTLGQLIGVLFLRSLERSERVYLAMRSRGFSGQVRVHLSFRVKPWDYCWSGLIISVALLLMAVDRGGFWH